MKKFGKKGIVAAASLIAALSVSAIVPAVANAGGDTTTLPSKGFESESVEIKGSNEALSNWMFYFYGDKDAEGKNRGTVYDSENLHVSATTEGRTGNALHLKRDKADGELVMYSYAFDVKPDQNYVIGAFVKSLCAQTADNKVYFKIKEQSANGGVVGDEFAVLNSVDGRREDWTETTFSYKTSASAKTLILKICADGVGDFYVDDITFRASNAGVNSDIFQMIGVGNGVSEDQPDAANLSGVNISSDSSDGDGKSLKLEHKDVYKTVFGMLPHGRNYKLSFKYKNIGGGTADGLGIRLDNVTLGGERKWYADPVSSTAGTPDTEWKTYEYEFTAVAGQTDVCWMAISSTGGYLIDELKITGTDEGGETMQYIVNGSFSGAYLEGYTYGGNYNVAKQEDGTYVFASSAVTKDTASGQRGYLKPDVSKLVEGTEYTISFDYRSGGGGAGNVFYGAGWGGEFGLTDICPLGQATTAGWTHKEAKFTARNGSWIEIYGDAGAGWPTYFRNISIKDAAGNEFITNKTLVAPKAVLGENEFPYGTFEGNVDFVAEDWTFEGNANVFGLTFDTRWEPGAKPDWKLCLYGSEEAPASAISKEIAVTKRTLAVGYETQTGKFKVSALAGDKEIEADENGFIELPEGTTSVKLKFTATEYTAFKKIFLGTHTHAQPADGATTTEEATCTKPGGTFYYCADCERNVYIEKVPMLAHDLEHVHEDATCRDGVDKDVCKLCKQEFNVKILPATGKHDYKTEIIKDATCTASGMKQDVCKVCGSKGNTSVILKKAHDYKDGKCTVCGAEDPDYKPESGESSSEKPTSEKPSAGESGAGSGSSSGGCGSSVYGGAMALGTLAAAAIVMIKRKKED
mgnify:FL=1